MEAFSTAAFQHDTARFRQLAAGPNSMVMQDEVRAEKELGL
jgi:hypothetical protein